MTRDELLRQWTDEMPKITRAELSPIELRNGRPFPEQYLEVMTVFGTPYFEDGKVHEVDWRKHDGASLSAEERQDIDPINGVSTFDKAEAIAAMTDLVHTYAARGRPMIPAGMFPFSTDSAGNWLLFKGDDPQRGSVWIWIWSDDIWGEGDNIWIGFVADDFDDFLFKRLRAPRGGE
jgi:SMI1 / KNR4 family (SUKH-1)